MASKSLISDIDQNFCQCCVCLDQYKEPKLLPCLHRFCTECLEKLIRVNPKRLSCPVCREECEVLEDGTDGFKVDFNMKNIVDFIELQKSLEEDQVRECIGCSSTESVVAYCFKCTDFLCEKCYKYHVNNNMMKDHRQHILSLKDVESGSITLEKLVSLKEAPRCKTHPENLSQLCCSTCANMPICVACSYGQRHKDHDIHDVIDIAKKEKETLSQNLALLNASKDELYDARDSLKRKQSNILSDMKEKNGMVTKQYEDDRKAVEMQNKEIRSQKVSEELKAISNKESVIKNLREKMEAEIKQARDKYQELCMREQQECEAKLKCLAEKLEEDEAKLDEEKNSLEENMRQSKEALKIEEKEKMNKTNEELQHYDSTIKRLENLNSTASCILAANNDWTSVQCIPDVCSAVQPLIQDMRIDCKEPAQSSTSQSAASNISDGSDEAETSQITLKYNTSTVYIDKIRSEGWKVIDIVSIDSYIVIFGETKTLKRKFISLHDLNGDLLRRTKMTFCDQPLCVGFNDSMIAMAYKPRVVALFDIFDDGLKKKNTKEDFVDRFFNSDSTISCIGADEMNQFVILGFCESSALLKYDDNLDYCGCIILPYQIPWPTKIAAARGNIIVCGEPNQSMAVILSLKGEIIHEFNGNDPEQPITSMFSVDADENGFFYVVGLSKSSFKVVIAMYDNKKNPLVVRPLNGDAWCLTKGNNTRKILMIDGYSGFLSVQELYEMNGRECQLVGLFSGLTDTLSLENSNTENEEDISAKQSM